MAIDYAHYTGLQDAQAGRDQAMQRLMALSTARNDYFQKQVDAEKAKALDMQQEQSRGWLDTGLSGAATGMMAGGSVGAAVGGGLGLAMGLYSASKNTKGGFKNAVTHPFGQHVDMNDVYGAMGPLASLGAGAASRLGAPSATDALLAQDPTLAGSQGGYGSTGMNLDAGAHDAYNQVFNNEPDPAYGKRKPFGGSGDSVNSLDVYNNLGRA